MITPIWLNNPLILLNNKSILEIWPKPTMTVEEKINAITRLIILLTILGYFITMDTKILLISSVTLAILLLLYYIQINIPKDKIKEQFVNNRMYNNLLPEVYPSFTDPTMYEMVKNKLSKPSESNPLMNVLVPDVYYKPDKKAAAPAFNKNVETEINNSVKKNTEKNFNDKNIDQRLFNDLGDDFIFDRSMRQWYSNPSTTTPNDQKGFQEWLYGSMISGKEGNALALERNQGGAYNYTMY
jgi:hypothetical protein